MDRLFRWQCISVLSWRSRNENVYYRWCIDFFNGTSGEELFTDGKLPLPSVPSIPMDKVLRATSCPWNNANYLFHQRILHIHRLCIHFSIGTDGQPRFTDGKLPIPSVPSDGQGFQGLPHALAITLTTCFTKGFYTFTDCVFISPSVRTDNLALPTVNCLYRRYRRYRRTRFFKATSCPWNNANYLFHQTILHIHRWCIHFSIGTDGSPKEGIIHESNRWYACYSIGQPSIV